MAADIRWQQRFVNYTRALEQLERFFEPPALNEREQQGLIKAFETTFELAWTRSVICCVVKATKACLVPETRCEKHSALS